MIPDLLFAFTLRDDNLFKQQLRIERMIEDRRGNALFWDFALISSERLRLIFQRHPEH